MGPVAFLSDRPFFEENDMASESKNAEIERLRAALEAIALIGGNLPDERLTDRTGPNDAAYRGQMYVNARNIAREALKSC